MGVAAAAAMTSGRSRSWAATICCHSVRMLRAVVSATIPCPSPSRARKSGLGLAAHMLQRLVKRLEAGNDLIRTLQPGMPHHVIHPQRAQALHRCDDRLAAQLKEDFNRGQEALYQRQDRPRLLDTATDQMPL